MSADLGVKEDGAGSSPGAFQRFFTKVGQHHQQLLDKFTPYVVVRWIVCCVLCAVYLVRVYFLQGYHIITYALGIYILNLFILFLTPKIDPALQELEDTEDGPSLPTTSSQEFRPFMRRLPEFKFWYSAVKAFLFAFGCTFFEALNVPVFWPILVMYFIILFTVTMKRQIKHMIKFRYIPFTHGKARYKGKEDGGKVSAQ